MANELRVRAPNLLPIILTVGVDEDDTTFTGTNLTTYPIIGATNHMAIFNRVTGEVAYITAHTTGAGSCTVVRAQEGTTGVASGVDGEWYHGPTIRDFVKTTPAGIRLATGVAVVSTTWAFIDAATHRTVTAFVGDRLMASASFRWANQALLVFADLVTVVSAAQVNSLSQNAAAGTGTTGEGCASLMADASALFYVASATLSYRVASGDLSTGSVTVGIMARLFSAGSRTMATGSQPLHITLTNHGPDYEAPTF